MPAIPTPPPDLSGGYMITKYTNGTDTHRNRVHVRPFGSDGTFTSPSATGNPTVMAEWTAFMGFFGKVWNGAWTLTLDSIWKNNLDGTFTELFGWASPASVAGTGTVATPNDQDRATQKTMTFHDGVGTRMRLIQIGIEGTNAIDIPFFIGGNPAGSDDAKLVDYLSTASKSNIVSRSGHVVQSPAHVVYCVNRRLRRHYGYA